MSTGDETGGRSLRNGNLGFVKLSLRNWFSVREKEKDATEKMLTLSPPRPSEKVEEGCWVSRAGSGSIARNEMSEVKNEEHGTLTRVADIDVPLFFFTDSRDIGSSSDSLRRIGTERLLCFGSTSDEIVEIIVGSSDSLITERVSGFKTVRGEKE